MKLPIPSSTSRRVRRQTHHSGFTLPETVMALAILLFIVAGIMYAHLFGLRLFQINNNKLQVTQWGRLTIENLADQIHRSYGVQVGNKTPGGFTGFLPGETNQGNGLLIQPTANTNNYIVYFVDSTSQTFQRTDQAGNAIILADSVTNAVIFAAEDFRGNVLTNNQNNQLIHLTLEFYRPPTYLVDADFFKLESSIKQRVVPQ